MTREQLKERCKLAFCSGNANLPQLSVRYGIPYDSLKKYCGAEGWVTTKKAASEIASTQIAPKIADWLEKERGEQVKRAIKRGARLHTVIDSLLDSDANVLKASEIRDIATAEEKIDATLRRNLGMDSEGGGNGRFNLNVIGDVQIVSDSH